MGMIGSLLRVSNDILESYINDSSLLTDRVYNEKIHNDSDFLDLDKSWDGLVFLLTNIVISNSDEFPNSVFLNGQVLDEFQDFGYGPAFYLPSIEVKNVYSEIKDVSIEELKNRYNPDLMKELGVYPQIWEQNEDSLNYILEYFEFVKKFYKEAAEMEFSIISFVS